VCLYPICLLESTPRTVVTHTSYIEHLMSASLVPGLSFGPNLLPLPPPGQFLLITDHLASPADFILHRALALQLKPVNSNSHRPRVILVSVASDFAHWCAIASKSNINLKQHMTAGSLTYIDGLSLSVYQSPKLPDSHNVDKDGYLRCPPLFAAGNGESSLKALYDIIARLLRYNSDDTISQNMMIIMDDITLLELIGVPSITITRFIRAARALCCRHTSALVIRAHCSPSPSAELGMPFDSDLLRVLVDVCHAHIEVRPLASGRSGAVSGEIAVQTGGLTLNGPEGEAGMGRKGSIQYRLNDGGVVYFQKGMGAGVL
jgi:Elongation complex protein 6